MKRDCSTCIYKEGSCYPSATIFDKDKTCKSYDPDYEGYIAELEKKLKALEGQTPWKDIKDKSEVIGKLTTAKELLKEFCTYYMYDCDETRKDYEMFEKLKEQAEQFLKEI